MIEQQFIEQLQQYYRPPQAFLIAFSGGLDSTALLSLCKKLREKQPHFSLRAIHIHHNLSPHADQWLAHCQQLCYQWQIPFISEKVQVQSKQGIEAGAREARYQAIKKHRFSHEILVTAHHQQDQTESFLLALKRGSGIQGLGAMQIQSQLFDMPIFRPLLNFSRWQLQDYVQQQGICWINDESNQDNQYDRNFLRNQVLPILRQRWQHFDQAVQRSAQHCYQQQQLINELLANEFAQIYNPTEKTLYTAKFPQYSPLKQAALLRLWLQQHQLAMPSSQQLAHILAEVVFAKMDKNPEFRLGQVILRRYQQRLFITPPYQDLSQVKLELRIDTPLSLPDQLGILTLQKKGKKLTALWQTENKNYHSEFYAQGDQFEVTFGYSGKIKLDAKRPNQDIKKVWQQLNVPVWQRSRIPLISEQQQLKSAVGFFVVLE
ncbi:tRNA lysidine(34) synthetase TilS [Volucribacter amazonae]|uniref:tRNA(Ile)-lysidine synthase n=1 Tax=Volucribacter amazonae TaxID=256731 RepID=A0A9X4SIX4_9PAST|nr:tRNA lysidine(34) synthetase TilS [Volucribacter amazonae]MDG6896145.1 tRNA(Ile)-lysidine synthase [Volucribacter amazonae]